MIQFLIIRNISSVILIGTLNPSFNPVLSKEKNLAIFFWAKHLANSNILIWLLILFIVT